MRKCRFTNHRGGFANPPLPASITQYREEICLVVLDMMNPRINGYEVYRNLARLNPQARFLIITGYSDSELMGEMFQPDRTQCIKKPIILSELTQRMGRLLHGREHPGRFSDLEVRPLAAKLIPA